MTQKKLTLLGAGTMGTGIAQLFAQCGFYVTLIANRIYPSRNFLSMNSDCFANGY